LHAGIFLITGICFWEWMLLDAALLAFFVRKNLPDVPIFTHQHFLLSIFLIGGAALWFKPTQLAWLDVPVSYTYRLEAELVGGKTVALPPRFFAPYDYQFTLGDFGYLTEEPHLGIVWGATRQRTLVKALQSATSLEHIQALESQFGRRSFDPGRCAVFDRFVRRFAANWNTRNSGTDWWRLLAAPRQLWTFDGPTSIRKGESIRRVIVYQVTSLFDGEHYRELRRNEVRTVEVAAFSPEP
jgi:hypothetical protein